MRIDYIKLYTVSSSNISTRKLILEAAHNLLKKSEGRLVRMEDIAQAASISRQALYLHFSSRVSLMIAVVQHINESQGYNESFPKVMEKESALEALDEFLELSAASYPEVYSIAKVLMSARYEDEAAAAAWEDRMELAHFGCELLVTRLDEEQILNGDWDIKTATDTLWMLIAIENWQSLVIDRGWTQEKYTAFIKRIVHRTLVQL